MAEEEIVPSRVLLVDFHGAYPGATLLLEGCLQQMGYEPELASPFPDSAAGIRLPSGALASALHVGFRRLTFRFAGYERVILPAEHDPDATRAQNVLGRRLLPKRTTLEWRIDETSTLVGGFALGELERNRVEEEESETTKSGAKNGGVVVGIPGVPPEAEEGVSALMERIGELHERFAEAAISFLLLDPVPDSLEEVITKRGLSDSLVTRYTGVGPHRYRDLLTDSDALLNTGEVTAFWGAALNRPIITSTLSRLPGELRSLSVYFGGPHIEEIAEKVLAGQMDRESLSYLRISPHIYAQATAASLREERGRLEKLW